MVRLRKLVLVAFFAASFSAVNAFASSTLPAQGAETQESANIQKEQSEQQAPFKLLKAKYSGNNSEAFIPQIEGMKDTALQNSINNALRTSIIPPNTSIKGDFEVTLYNEDLLGIHFQGVSTSAKEAQPSNIDKTIHIDLTNGKIYKLGDLFKPVDFESTIKKICSANDSKLRLTNTAQPAQWTYEDFAKAWNKETGSFVLLGDSIIVYSEQAEGIIGYKVPYSDLKDIINTNGELWNKIQGLKAHY